MGCEQHIAATRMEQEVTLGSLIAGANDGLGGQSGEGTVI